MTFPQLITMSDAMHPPQRVTSVVGRRESLRPQPKKARRMLAALGTVSPLLAVPLLAAVLASFALWRDGDGRLVTGLHSGWGDMLLHLRAAIFFAEQGGWPQESFLLAGKPVGYAFASDLLSGWLWKNGLTLPGAIAVPTIALCALFFLGLESLALTLTGSRRAAALSALLFFGFGGLSGWFLLPTLVAGSAPWWVTLRDLSHEVTVWHERGVAILTPSVMMLHQRSYLLGFPVLLLVLALVSRFLRSRSLGVLGAAVAAVVLLAFVHPFTWVTVLLLLPPWLIFAALLGEHPLSRRDVVRAAVAYALMVLLGWLVVRGLQPTTGATAVRFHLGWLAPGPQWVWFWLLNLGGFLVLWPLTIRHLLRANRSLAALTIASVVPFLVGNVLVFTPWEWDNTKIFAPVWLILALAVGSLLASWWHTGGWGRKVVLCFLLIFLTGSGGLEMLRVFSFSGQPLVLSAPDGERLGAEIRRATGTRDLLLTAPTPDNPAFIFSGRPSLVAYEGWLWSQGWRGQYEERIVDTQAIYTGAENAEALLEKHGVSFVAIGSPERAVGANEAWFAARYPVVLHHQHTTIYDVRGKDSF